MRRVFIAVSLCLFALGAILVSRWPDLLVSFQEWQRRRDEAAAAPFASQLDIYSSLTLRLFWVARSDDPRDVVNARAAADRCLNTALLRTVPAHLDWNRHVSLHVSHIVLGRAALLEGDVARAECHLMSSVADTFSVRFYSPLPDMTLAHELLVLGRTDVVRQYLAACRQRWPVGGPEDLTQWESAIASGHIPDFERRSAWSRVPNPGVQRTRFARR